MLELLALPAAAGSAARAPLVFVHGAYVGAWCWAEHFLPWFAARGHDVYALSLRGHGKSAGRERLHAFGLADFAEDLAAALQEALFAGPVEGERLERYFRRMQPESRRAILDMSGWGLPQIRRTAMPDTLVIGAERDLLISPALAQTTAQLLGAEYLPLPGLGHAVVLEPGWRAAAEGLAGWLAERDA